MSRPTLPLLLLALAAPAAMADDRRPAPRMTMTQVIIREHVTIRVPRMAQPAPASIGVMMVPVPIKWKEKKGPKCITVASMAGVMVTSVKQVDLVLRGGQRMRARLGGACRPLDFYSGFYLRPAEDGTVCAGRDAIRTQSGTSCPIDAFKALVPAR